MPTSTTQPHLTLTCLWSALTSSHVPPTPSAPHLLDSPCSSPDHSALGSCGRSHTGGWGCWPGHPAAAGRGGPRGQGLLAPSLAVQAGASLPSLSHPSACPQVLEQRRCPWVGGEIGFLPLSTDGLGGADCRLPASPACCPAPRRNQAAPPPPVLAVRWGTLIFLCRDPPDPSGP